MWSVFIDSQTTVLQCLVKFCRSDQLYGDITYDCSICAERAPATKSLHFNKVSPIITIHLKRFKYNQQTNTVNKIKTFISYPELLNLALYFDHNTQESITANKENNVLIYQLYAIVVHLGGQPTSGHVYACIVSYDGFWYKANDNSIAQLDINEVLTNQDAYMLFYSKAPENRFTINETTVEVTATSLSRRLLYVQVYLH